MGLEGERTAHQNHREKRKNCRSRKEEKMIVFI